MSLLVHKIVLALRVAIGVWQYVCMFSICMLSTKVLFFTMLHIYSVNLTELGQTFNISLVCVLCHLSGNTVSKLFGLLRRWFDRVVVYLQFQPCQAWITPQVPAHTDQHSSTIWSSNSFSHPLSLHGTLH